MSHATVRSQTELGEALADSYQGRRRAGITRRRTKVLAAQALWHRFAESTIGALIGCLAFFTVLYAVLLLFPTGAHS